MSDSNEQKLVAKSDGQPEPEMDSGLSKALDTYRKLIESDEMTPEQQSELEKKVKEIQDRDIIESDATHEPQEIESEKDKVMIGPPVLTRFEKARIMGARALQLSLGAPPFITIPDTARTSLDIAMEELDKRVIPIIIKRILPNGNYQNIPIGYFKHG